MPLALPTRPPRPGRVARCSCVQTCPSRPSPSDRALPPGSRPSAQPSGTRQRGGGWSERNFTLSRWSAVYWAVSSSCRAALQPATQPAATPYLTARRRPARCPCSHHRGRAHRSFRRRCQTAIASSNHPAMKARVAMVSPQAPMISPARIGCVGALLMPDDTRSQKEGNHNTSETAITIKLLPTVTRFTSPTPRII